MGANRDQMIDLLAESAGIEPGYYDTWGKWIVVSREVKADLLEAIGFDISSSESIQHELKQFELRYQRSPLRPVTVVWQSALPAGILVTVPIHPESRWRLSIAPEQGGRISRLFVPSEIGIAEIISTPSGEQAVVRVLIGEELMPGYHRVELAIDNAEAESVLGHSLLIVAPDTCYLPPEILPDKRVFGVGVQLPSLCSYRDLGAGDLGHLSLVIDAVAGWGGSFVGLNPLHASSYRDAASISPYSPESRSSFSPLLINIEEAAKFLGFELSDDEFERLILDVDSLRIPDLVDHLGVWHFKRSKLEELFERFLAASEGGTAGPVGLKFVEFVQSAHPPMLDYAAFRAIQESLEEQDPSVWGWPVWPEELRDRSSSAVEAKIKSEKRRFDFHLFLQWLACEQLEKTVEHCRAAGLPLGLYLDLALGSNGAGADVWARKDLYALNASLGAPPDLLNAMGQDWGLPPLVPFFLEYAAYGPFIEALRANMRFAGALRIDHFMSLMRLYWVPRGRAASEGAYLRYPFEELLGILALESQRNRCVVIGEDLGTVPDGLREEMERRSILSYKVLSFMKESATRFVRPSGYPRKALVTSGTHDMATIRGWWLGADIENWEQFDMLRPPLTGEGLRSDRVTEKREVVALLAETGLGEFDQGVQDLPARMAAAISALLASTPSLLQVIQAEDLFNLREQVNVPGTVSQHPNWRRRIPVPVEKWVDSDEAAGVIAGVKKERSR